MDPIHIASVIIIAILAVGGLGLSRHSRTRATKGATVGIKDLEFFSDENKAKRKARRQAFAEDVKDGLGNLDDAERAHVMDEMEDVYSAFTVFMQKSRGGQVDVVAGIKLLAEGRDVLQAVREGIVD